METKETQTGIEKYSNDEIVQQLNSNVINVIGSDKIQGFEKAYLVADAMEQLKKLLTPQYMRPIMELQGSRLGFKTDKDKDGGYPEKVVKDCLIDAVLSGVQPAGNQFNIIAGNMYITKEGFGYLLNNMPGLSYEITFELPRINNDKTSAAVIAIINWKFSADKEMKEKKMDIPIKMNNYMGTDAVIGKATRKARAWLFNTIAGTEFGDGDVTDVDSKVVSSKLNGTDKEVERLNLMISDCKTPKQLEELKKSIPSDKIEACKEAINSKMDEFLTEDK